jgi:acetoin utilization protein AcuB
MHRIPVRAIMQSSVITIDPDALVADAAQLLEEFRIRRLPVTDEDERLIGIVTATDIREAEAASNAANNYEPDDKEEWLTVADIMSRDVVTIDPDATVGQLAVKFMEYKIGSVPVVENTTSQGKPRLVGIVTETDIFRMIADAWQNETLAQPTRATPHP